MVPRGSYLCLDSETNHTLRMENTMMTPVMTRRKAGAKSLAFQLTIACTMMSLLLGGCRTARLKTMERVHTLTDSLAQRSLTAHHHHDARAEECRELTDTETIELWEERGDSLPPRRLWRTYRRRTSEARRRADARTDSLHSQAQSERVYTERATASAETKAIRSPLSLGARLVTRLAPWLLLALVLWLWWRRRRG